jgi:hypothetical protein
MRSDERVSFRPAVVGDGATLIQWTDRTACTIERVSASGKTFWMREDTAKRVDNRGRSEHQTYRYLPNPLGRLWTVRMTKHGWSIGGLNVLVGGRAHYYDYSF